MQVNQPSYNYYYGFPDPGPQASDPNHVFEHLFFEDRSDWKDVREFGKWDYVVIGSGFCGLAFVERTLSKQPDARVLMLERGGHFLPCHFQNLPPAYKETLPNQIFHTETYPWSLSQRAVENKPGATWQHGMVPFFGGRSTLWSAWCPRPDKDDLAGWPDQVSSMLSEEFFAGAESLLNVVPASEIDSEGIKDDKRIYFNVQREFQKRLQDAVKGSKIPSAYRSQAAPLAVADSDNTRSSFTKFSVNSKLLSLLLADKQAAIKRQEDDAKQQIKENGKFVSKPLHLFRRFIIKTDCIVKRILMQGDVATGLDTSQGVVVLSHADDSGEIHNSELILAVGCIPAATLLLNSVNFKPGLAIPGAQFGAHYISAITARIRGDYLKDIGFDKWNDLEIGALYLGGKDRTSGLTWHSQISILSFKSKEIDSKILSTAQRFMPDVVSTASPEQIHGSNGYVIFVFAVLGEMDLNNSDNFVKLTADSRRNFRDETANVELSWRISENDKKCWELMESDSNKSLEALVGGPKNASQLEYWDFASGQWVKRFQSLKVPGMVHESSVIPIGPDNTKHPVDLNFRVRQTKNIYATGSGLWPTATSINPTMTMCGFAQRLADERAAEKVRRNTSLESSSKKQKK